MSKVKEFTVGKSWVSIGISKRFGIGIYIDRYSMGIDFVCLWLAIEL